MSANDKQFVSPVKRVSSNFMFVLFKNLTKFDFDDAFTESQEHLAIFKCTGIYLPVNVPV
jgi:hypothetical protein